MTTLFIVKYWTTTMYSWMIYRKPLYECKGKVTHTAKEIAFFEALL